MKLLAKSKEAEKAYSLVTELQKYFVNKLDNISLELGKEEKFKAVEWLRDNGLHGGGVRYEATDNTIFNRGSVNISQVHYDDNKDKKLSSATALSAIIHPLNPHAPSMHMHISWTQMRNSEGYWRIMADLNPSLKNDLFERDFKMKLYQTAGEYGDKAIEEGVNYFTIPVLNRTRGVSHFYLENFNRGDFEEDYTFAKKMGIATIDAYIGIVLQALHDYTSYTEEEKNAQIDYHTLYLFQVLTLDRGTTSGLLIHNQNDLGIMGSIPSHINRELLSSWVELMPKPQDELVKSLLEALPKGKIVLVDERVKIALAKVVREHYLKYPEALKLQASGGKIPDTVGNHR